jgi:hypothetical protein
MAEDKIISLEKRFPPVVLDIAPVTGDITPATLATVSGVSVENQYETIAQSPGVIILAKELKLDVSGNRKNGMVFGNLGATYKTILTPTGLTEQAFMAPSVGGYVFECLAVTTSPIESSILTFPLYTSLLSSDDAENFFVGLTRQHFKESTNDTPVFRPVENHNWGEGKVTATDRFYFYRIIGVQLTIQAGAVPVQDLISIPACSLGFNALMGEVGEFEEMMLLRRSFELQQEGINS